MLHKEVFESNQYHNSQESGSIHSNQMPSASQQHYFTHPQRRNKRNKYIGSGYPQDNGTYCCRSSGCGCSHGTSGGVDGSFLMILKEVV